MGKPTSILPAFRLVAILGLALVLLIGCVPLQVEPVETDNDQSSLCGNGFAPDYGFSYDLLQPHWTVGWQGNVVSLTVRQVDTILDELDADSIAQTMILILPADQVGIRTNCAVHFLRYMKLGLPSGPHKDNGFVFLIVREPDGIDVHYAVGLGLPALTAPELTNINRAVENTYESTGSLDQALLTLAQEFNTVARNKYDPEFTSETEPLALPTSIPVERTQDPITQPEQTEQPIGQTEEPIGQPVGSALSIALCGQLCFWAILIWFLIGMFSRFAGGHSRRYTPYSGPWDGTHSRGGFRGFPSRGFPSGGSRRSSGPRMRGGSGSGRSGRTN
ncbi:MAG TPA: hypothetical protein VK851_13190 [Anaerolineales bacterium]|nr:hypothetical protein [Anaerolineales bacterium]